jgi:pimeloyl-ACP methyl ester carboxylesterase
MRIQSGAIVNVTNSVFSNNTADTGGAIDNDGTLSLIRTLLTGNTAQGLGGAISNSRDILVDNSRLSDNSASSGGGVYNSGFAVANNTSISENTATGDGGGLANSGRITINRSTIVNNQARVGGGIDNMPSGLAEIFNSTISNNTASEIGGGVNNSRTMGIVNSTLSGNQAGLFGGGISNLSQIGQSRGNLLLINTLISGNTATPTLESIDRNLPRLIGIDPPYDFGTDDPTSQSGAEIANLGQIQFQGGNLLGSNGDDGFTQDFSILFTAAPLFNILPGESSGSFTTPNLPTSQIITGLGGFGGVTQTHNLVPGSPAINTGTASTSTASLNALTTEPSPTTTGFIGGSLSYKITEELLAPLNGLIFLESILDQDGRILNQEGASLSAGEVYDAYLALNPEFSDLVSRDEYIRELDQLSSQATDQRGAPRPVGGAFDIGAVEFGSTAPPIPQPPAAPTPPPPPPATPPTSGGGTPQTPSNFSRLPDSAFSDLYRRNLNGGDSARTSERLLQEREAFFQPNNWLARQGVGVWRFPSGPNFERYQQVTGFDGRSFAVGIAPYKCNDCNRFRGGGVNILEEPINPGLQTTFYTHGWNSDHNSPGSAFFARTMERSSSVQQGVMVDWGEGSQTGAALATAVARIPTVARALAIKILESGLRPKEVDLVGHSLGAYVSVEAAAILYREFNFPVNSVIMLDPANINIQMRAGNSYDRSNLSDLSFLTSTLAVYTNESFPISVGTLFSDARYAAQAQRTIEIVPAFDPLSAHGAPNQLLSTTSRLGGPYRLDAIREVINSKGSLAEYFRNENSRVFKLDEDLALRNHVRLRESLF